MLMFHPARRIRTAGWIYTISARVHPPVTENSQPPISGPAEAAASHCEAGDRAETLFRAECAD